MFDNSNPNEIENWSCVKEAGKDYEIEMAKNFLSDHDIPATKLSKRDKAFSLTMGEMSMVYLYVPNEYEEQALELLESTELDDELGNEEE